MSRLSWRREGRRSGLGEVDKWRGNMGGMRQWMKNNSGKVCLIVSILRALGVLHYDGTALDWVVVDLAG